MACHALQVNAVEGSLTFTNTIVHRSTGASSRWHGREREIGESEKNNLKRHQQPLQTKLAFHFSNNLYIHCKLL